MQVTDRLLSSDLTLNEVLEITGTLTFDPEKSITLITSKNIILTGKLVMKPARPEVVHTIRFTGIVESKFVGEGMEVLDSDTGLWVMGAGQLDLAGHDRIGWTRATGTINNGSTTIPVVNAQGWRVGDEIVIMPTAKGASNYDERIITAISGNILTLDKPATAHVQAEGFPPAEIISLTNNVRIEGTATGRTHVFIHATQKQSVSNTTIRHSGPNKTQEGMAGSIVAGRYGLHFHHAEDGSRGTVIKNVLVRDAGSHSFVPHGSHGITFDTCATYNTNLDSYWYDLGHSTHDLTYKNCIAAKIGFIPRSLDMDLWAIDKSDKVPLMGTNGFLLGRGDGNTITGCVVVGASGDPHLKGGYLWPTRDEDKPEGVWVFKNNLAHNCNCGLVVWQNTGLNHTNEDYFAYSNGQDGFHGAYSNSYVYHGGRCNGLFEIKSGSGDRLRFIDMIFGTVHMLGSALDSTLPALFLNCKWNLWEDRVDESIHGADIVNCEGPIAVLGLNTEVVRVQPKTGQPYRLTRSGKTNISAFAPTIWGSGTGLKGEYFDTATFTNKLFERIDSIVAFGDWGNLLHHLEKDTITSVRWTGKLLAQFTEAYTFTTGGGGSMKTFINGQQVTKVNLEAGKLYDVKVEFTNNDTNIRGGANWKWNSPSLNLFSPGGEYVPQLQLYPGDATPPPPPDNQKPTANAGVDAEITLPVSEYTLQGSGNDSDGTIVVYKWEKIEGGTAVITTPNLPVTKVTGLVQGVYRFRLTVTDDKGATAFDDVYVTVKPAPVINLPPSADAGPDTEHTLSVQLSGTAVDVDGQIVGVKWEQVSGPQVSISNADKNNASFIPGGVGVYEFIFSVTDDKGAVVSDKKRVVVK